MSATPISLSPDLGRLEAEGFRLRVVQGTAHHLLIEGIPAVTKAGKVVLGTLYAPLELDANGKTVNPVFSHQCWWIGEAPCDATGRTMSEMISNNAKEDRGDGIRTTVAFSRKRGDKAPYADFYEKIWTYVRMIWQEAQSVDAKCDPRSDKPVLAVVQAQERAFHYPDMATTRAGIGAATAKLIVKRVVLIGIGGTGSYIFDLVAKTPVEQIDIYDGGDFGLHNAFRAPGAPRKEDLQGEKIKKVDWFGAIYEGMHKGIKRHPYHVSEARLLELKGADFVFVAIDDGTARKTILEGLVAMGIPFVDVGLDLDLDEKASLRGMCRVTVGTRDCHGHIEAVVSFAPIPANDIYRNIQVADLNMLNAALAVMKWKKLCDFHADDMREHHSLYTIATHGLTKEDKA
jgi:hypothetical protein